MAMIQKTIPDGKGGVIELDQHDPRYWEGPYRYEPFPKLLFKAGPGAKYQEPDMQVVQNATEMERLGSQWAEDPDTARAIFDKQEAEFARIAAERNFSDRRLSESAQAEALAADRATDEMLPAIPEKRRGGRPKKIVTDS